MAVIADFIIAATGTSPTNAQRQAAILSGNYGGLTPVDADGQAVPANSPLSTELQQFKAGLQSGAIPTDPQLAGATNYLLWGAGLFLVWYFFIRGK
jgi:hypothetical protein